MSNEFPVRDRCGTRHKVCEPPIEFIETSIREQKLYIPQRLDGLNETTKANRTHWTKGAKHKKEQEEIVMWAIKESNLHPIAGAFRMEIHYSEPNDKRDPDNIASAKKFILDALQKTEIIKNDNQKFVKGWSESWGVKTPEMPVGVHIKLIEG